MTALLAWWWYKKSGLARGWVPSLLHFISLVLKFAIRLPSSDHGARGYHGSGSNMLDTIASVPWFLLGLAGIAYEYVMSKVDGLVSGVR